MLEFVHPGGFCAPFSSSAFKTRISLAAAALFDPPSSPFTACNSKLATPATSGVEKLVSEAGAAMSGFARPSAVGPTLELPPYAATAMLLYAVEGDITSPPLPGPETNRTL